MRRFLTAVVVLLGLALLFVIGMGAQSPVLALPAFLLWTPAAMWVGYTFARAPGVLGVRIELVKERGG